MRTKKLDINKEQYMDKEIVERIQKLEEANIKYRKKFNLLLIVAFIITVFSGLHMFIIVYSGKIKVKALAEKSETTITNQGINFSEGSIKKDAYIGIGGAGLHDPELGAARIDIRSIKLDNITMGSDTQLATASLENYPHGSSLQLWNKGIISATAKEFPMLKIITENNGWIKFEFSDTGAPQVSFGNKDRIDNFTLTIEDFRKLKKINF